MTECDRWAPPIHYRSGIRKIGLHLLLSECTRELCNILQITSTFKVELLAASITDCLLKCFDTTDDEQTDGQGNLFVTLSGA